MPRNSDVTQRGVNESPQIKLIRAGAAYLLAGGSPVELIETLEKRGFSLQDAAFIQKWAHNVASVARGNEHAVRV